MQVPQLEKDLGMEVYLTKSQGCGGRIRQLLEDFVVEEILVDGSLAEIKQPTNTWEPSGEGNYLICVLIKRRWDTFMAVREVAKKLHISQKRVRFGGIKDTKALTAQHISLQNMSPDRVLDVQIKDIVIYPWRFSRERMYSQLIRGNKFHITIRGIAQSASVIERNTRGVIEEIETAGGVPNFFGHQRFGTIRPTTHKVGKHLIRGEVERAALSYLAEPYPQEHPEAKEARQFLQDTMNFDEAFERFPKFLRYERSMLRHLTRYPNDYVGAFRTFPRRLRKLFVQAYQSYLFNRFVSERIRRGIPLDKPQIGDYVIRLDEHKIPTEEWDQVTEHKIQTMTAKFEDAELCVGAPLVGPSQPQSKGIQGEIEQAILEAENVKPEAFKIPFMPEATAEGRVRAIMNPVQDMQQEEVIDDKENPDRWILKLGFTLNRGSYATVILREFMKPQNLIEAGY